MSTNLWEKWGDIWAPVVFSSDRFNADSVLDPNIFQLHPNNQPINGINKMPKPDAPITSIVSIGSVPKHWAILSNQESSYNRPSYINTETRCNNHIDWPVSKHWAILSNQESSYNQCCSKKGQSETPSRFLISDWRSRPLTFQDGEWVYGWCMYRERPAFGCIHTSVHRHLTFR
jgi:hypothetical protein